MSSLAPSELLQPPFMIGTTSPAQTGAQMAGFYERLAADPVPVGDIWQAAVTELDIPKNAAIARAGAILAAALDAGHGRGIADGYHNSGHYVEVLLNTLQLIQRNNAGNDYGMYLARSDSAKLLFAALAHDFCYEPGGNKDAQGRDVPFRLERNAMEAARPYLLRAAVAAKDIAEIELMILTTDVSPASKAGAFLRAVHSHLFEGTPKPVPSEAQQPVAAVAEDRRLARMAALLSDADILSSAGLTIAYAQRQNDRLGREWNKQLGPQDTIGFLTFVAGNRFTTPAAAFFQPNMDAIRADAEAALHGPGPAAAKPHPPALERPGPAHERGL